MKTIVLNCIVLMALKAICFADETLSPFSGVDLSALPSENALPLVQAKADFEAISSGGRPKFAKRTGGLLDGGTSLYRGEGYTIWRYKRLCEIAGVRGILYGAVIEFEKNISITNEPKISNVKLFTGKALKALEEKALELSKP
jgi:hypothetical protein